MSDDMKVEKLQKWLMLIGVLIITALVGWMIVDLVSLERPEVSAPTPIEEEGVVEAEETEFSYLPPSREEW